MSLTAATTTELQDPAPRSGTWKFEIRTAWQTWQEFGYLGKQPRIGLSRDSLRTMNVTIPNSFDPATGLSVYASESDQTNYIQLEAEGRATALVLTASGLETRVMFLGKLDHIELNDFYVALSFSDWNSLALECEANVQLSPTDYQLVSGRVPLKLIAGGAYGRVYGIEYADSHDAFSDDTLRRRSWVLGTAQVWSHATLTSDNDHPTYEVPGAHYQVNAESGSMSLFEPAHTVYDIPAGAHTLRIPGDHTRYFISGYKFQIVESTANDGSYTLSVNSTYDGSAYTTLTIAGTFPSGAQAAGSGGLGSVYRNSFWIEGLSVYLETGGHASLGPDGAVVGANCDLSLLFQQAIETAKPEGIGAVAAEEDIASLGIDLGAPFAYRGKVSDLLQKIKDDFQANIFFRYDPAAVQSGTYPTWTTGKWKLQLVVQPASADYDLYNLLTCSQPRTNRDLYTCVIATGPSELPVNVLVDAILKDWTTGAPEFRYVNGSKLGPGEAKPGSKSLPLIVNGIDEAGCLVHNLAAHSDTLPSGGGRYDGWYQFFTVDRGSSRTINGARFVLPPTRNSNAANGDQRILSGGNAVGFWPGLWVQVSVDNVKWVNLAPALKGYFKPSSVIELSAGQITAPTFRYARFYCAAFKYGTGDTAGGAQNDPSIGLGEAAFYENKDYRVEKSVISVAGNYYYTSDTAQTSPVSRNYANMLTARNGRHKIKYLDLSGRYNEFLAHDVALQELEEGIRLYHAPRPSALCDPRLDIFNGVGIEDDLNGDVNILAEDIEWADHKTSVSGTNYRSGVWKA